MSSNPSRTGLRPAKLPTSQRVLLLVDFITSLDFPGADALAPHALAAARATGALRQRLQHEGVPPIYANDNSGFGQSVFHSPVSTCLRMAGPAAEIAVLLYPQA